MSATFWAESQPMIWYRIVINPELTFCRRLGQCDTAGVTPPSDMRPYSDKPGQLRKATARELGIDQSFIKETFIGRSLDFKVHTVSSKVKTASIATVTSASSAAPTPSSSNPATPPVTELSSTLTSATTSTPATPLSIPAATVTSAPSATQRCQHRQLLL